MKNKFISTGTALLAFTLLSAIVVGQAKPDQAVKHDNRHIKLMKIIDGKKIALDTVISADQLLVWQGDTINPPKHQDEFNSSGPDQMHQFDLQVNENGNHKNVMIFRKKGVKSGEPMIWQMETTGDDEDLGSVDGDSIPEKIIIRKHMRDDAQNRMFYRNDFDRKDFPPMPPVPPVPHFKMQQQGQVIDLNDPDIISYKKKNLSGGREKIEIIRKKSEKSETMTFEMDNDDVLVPPPPLAIPGKEGNVQHVKIRQKKTKVDGKDGKQIEVNVKTEENK